MRALLWSHRISHELISYYRFYPEYGSSTTPFFQPCSGFQMTLLQWCFLVAQWVRMVKQYKCMGCSWFKSRLLWKKSRVFFISIQLFQCHRAEDKHFLLKALVVQLSGGVLYEKQMMNAACMWPHVNTVFFGGGGDFGRLKFSSVCNPDFPLVSTLPKVRYHFCIFWHKMWVTNGGKLSLEHFNV